MKDIVTDTIKKTGSKIRERGSMDTAKMLSISLMVIVGLIGWGRDLFQDDYKQIKDRITRVEISCHSLQISMKEVETSREAVNYRFNELKEDLAEIKELLKEQNRKGAK